MQTAYILEAEMINNQTIRINEPLNISNKRVIVTIQPINDENFTLNQKNKFFDLAGKIDIDSDVVNSLREESMI